MKLILILLLLASVTSAQEYLYTDSTVVIQSDTSNLRTSYTRFDIKYCGYIIAIVDSVENTITYNEPHHPWEYKTPRWDKKVLGIELNERICPQCLLWQKVKIYHYKERILTPFEQAMQEKKGRYK